MDMEFKENWNVDQLSEEDTDEDSDLDSDEDDIYIEPPRKFQNINYIKYWCFFEKGKRSLLTEHKITVELQDNNIVLHHRVKLKKKKKKKKRSTTKLYKIYFSLLHMYRYCVDEDEDTIEFAFAFIEPGVIQSEQPNRAAPDKSNSFQIDENAPSSLKVCYIC